MAGVVVVSPVLVADGYGNQISSVGDRLKVDAEVSQGVGAPFPSNDPTRLARNYLRQDNSNFNLNTVDGSVTPQVFHYDAYQDVDVKIYEVRTVLVDNSLPFGDNKFGAAAALTNGLLYEVFYNGVATELATIQVNDEFMFLTPGPQVFVDVAGAADILTAIQQFSTPIVLRAGTNDSFRVTVRDNMTSFNFLRILVYGIKEA